MHQPSALTVAVLALLVSAVPTRISAVETQPASAKPASTAPGKPPAEVAAPAEAGASSEDAALENGAPPPGRPADVALWTAARKVNVEVIVVRRAAADLQQRAANDRLSKRLEQAIAQATPERATQIAQVKAKLDKAWNENYAIRTRPWPINTVRVCNQALLLMDSGMRAAAVDKRREAAVENARPPLKTCVDRASLAIKTMSASNDSLRAAIGEAQAALAEAPAAKGD